jgi:15-cis-phytoene synthase
MNTLELFNKVSIQCSKTVTRSYSTSFSIGIRCLEKSLREPIHAIYGFVRVADEIVDTFQGYNKTELLDRFKNETRMAIREGISTNPILHSFQSVVNRFHIEPALYETFLQSMEMDLAHKEYDQAGFETYVFGSAEMVGLMCLKVFCKNDPTLFDQLKPNAMKLGSAFQKINFLRDLRSDYSKLGRRYFPGLHPEHFDTRYKHSIEADIEADFRSGYEGIKRLPKSSRLALHVTYVYYYALFKRIKNSPPEAVLHHRIRIPNRQKLSLLAYSYVKHQLRLL